MLDSENNKIGTCFTTLTDAIAEDNTARRPTRIPDFKKRTEDAKTRTNTLNFLKMNEIFYCSRTAVWPALVYERGIILNVLYE